MKHFFTHGCIKTEAGRGGDHMGCVHLSLGPLHLHQGAHRVYVCCSQMGGQEGKWRGTGLSRGSNLQRHTSHASG